ncbi:hypothetical protein MRB53_024554 [Persea americana]|uniref:Uncharacterized protein n=1 Tax=Persea americana TaxID=3435 RepID=A0ACC2LCS7_PERAE|nr:hypothetical protein MRB53_024554 [Persea americana]
MTQMGQLWLQREASTTMTGMGSGRVGRRDGPRTTSASGVATTDHGQSCYCLRRLMRKLKRHSKMLCSGTRPTTFHCHYDPLSYAKNFDRSSNDGAFGDDSDRFYTFSSRFAAAPSTATPVAVLATSH